MCIEYILNIYERYQWCSSVIHILPHLIDFESFIDDKVVVMGGLL